MTAAHRTTKNTIIVGGGHAGVNLGCMLELEQPDEDYLILERSNALLIKWRQYRWEGFNLNTPVKFGMLHGQNDDREPWLLERPMEGELQRWDAHIAKLQVKHKLNSNVVQVTRKDGDEDTFETMVEEIHPETKEKMTVVYESKNVVVCNGYYDKPVKPIALSESIPSAIKQHQAAFLKFDDLHPGNVLLVGSGQTGVQVADLLLQNKPDVKLYLATSDVSGCPRSFQGRDLFEWLDEMKFLTMPRAALDSMPREKAESIKYKKAPVTGPTKEISPFSLYRRGVSLFGHLDRVESVEGRDDVTFHFKDDRAKNLKTCAEGYLGLLKTLRDHAGTPDAPPAPEWDNLEDDLMNTSGPLSLSVKDNQISNVVWCTGWSHDFSWLHCQCKDDDFDQRTKAPDVIVSKSVPGLFYCGFNWIGTLQSLNLVEFDHDAKIILDNLK